MITKTMKKILIFPIICLFLFAACKPTEKNYKNAYDTAIQAVEKKNQKERESESGRQLESFDGPRIEIVKGDTLYVHKGLLKPYEPKVTEEKGRNGVAIARYSRITNARKHAQDMKDSYDGAFVATDGHENYYVMIKRVADMEEAADVIHVFRLAHPDYHYIGLSGQPLTVFFSPD